MKLHPNFLFIAIDVLFTVASFYFVVALPVEKLFDSKDTVSAPRYYYLF